MKASARKTHLKRTVSKKAGKFLLGISFTFLLLLGGIPIGGTLASGDDKGNKNAYINGSTIAQNGGAGAYQDVSIGDAITYMIDAENVRSPIPAYDVLFLLDWSGSMENGLMVPGESAKLYERDLMQDMSEFILENYPSSRIALLGMNTGFNPRDGDSFETTYNRTWKCSNNPNYSYIQLQTDFLTKTQYEAALPSINAAFDAPITFEFDDNAQFLAAAINKLSGYSTTYGSSLGGSYPKALIPRTDKSRIPIIVHISDFQMTERTTTARAYLDNKTNPQEPYWSVTMKRQADIFKSLFPTGIYLTVRADHSNQTADHNIYSTAALSVGFDSPYWYTGFGETGGFTSSRYDGYMASYVSSNFVKIPYGTTYTTAFSAFKADFLSHVPMPQGTIITDVVPDGLVVDLSSISHGGVYDPDTRTITWDLTGQDQGEITVQFTATVDDHGRFENTANILNWDDTEADTNTTYHATKTTIIEQFREREDHSNVLMADQSAYLTGKDTYIPASGIPPATLIQGSTVYTYWGYQVDGGIIYPGLLASFDFSADPSASHTIKYLYTKGNPKSAKVNGGAVDIGSDTDPVPVKIGDILTYEIRLNNILPPTAQSSTVTDVIPTGLNILNVSHSGVIGSDGQTITWDLTTLPEGALVLTVTAEVTQVGVFNNTAYIAPWNEAAYHTNTTYHAAGDVDFEFYKVDETTKPMENVSFTLYRCTRADDPGHVHDWLYTNDGSSCWGDPTDTISDPEGLVRFMGLVSGDYMLVETATQPGYQLPYGQWLVVVDDTLDITVVAHGYGSSLPPGFRKGADQYDGYLLLPNYREMIMPQAGGAGLVVLAVLGIACLGGAAIYLLISGPKKRR